MSYTDIGERYALIEPVLRKYKRRFTVLDFGAYEGDFAFRLTREFDCVVVCIEADTKIIERCREENSERVLALNRRFIVEDIETLAECEHFDVVLALNVLHHYEDWRKMLAALMLMSSMQFIQTPKEHDDGCCGSREVKVGILQAVSGWKLLGSTSQFVGHMERPLYCCRDWPHGQLTRTWFGAHPGSADASVIATSIDKTIALLNKGQPHKPWVYGFNLANFCALGGTWPPREKVLEDLRKMPLAATKHGDINIHNIIYDGENMQLIDGGEGWITWDDRENLKKVIEKVDAQLR